MPPPYARRPDQPRGAWLLSPKQREAFKANKDTNTTITRLGPDSPWPFPTASFDALAPPRLVVWNPFGTYWNNSPAPLEINAPQRLVWDIIMDFDSYKEWNPFHRMIHVLARDDEAVRALRLVVDIDVAKGDGSVPPADKKPNDITKSAEDVMYFDDERCILLYGLGSGLITSMRGQVVVANGSDKCVYHSTSNICGTVLVAVSSLQPKLVKAFQFAALALKARAERLAAAEKPSAGSNASL